jgi:ABC-type sulfate transport system permease subunit
MRDFIIVTILCIAAAIAVDHFWFDGKYFGAVTQDLGFSASSVQRRPAN